MSQKSAPQQFGPYHLLEKIATGGMAEVWRARQYGMAGFEKILVIKKVLPNLAQDQEFINLFVTEAHIAVKLTHVNIVQVFDLGLEENTHYMAMEYVHGLDLARLMSRAKPLGPFPVALALFVIAEVLKALQFAHERLNDETGEPLNIVHCDISPQNILVSYAGEVKITDFGISRAAFQSSGAHDVIRGKYAYMSPEQVDGKPLDGRSDVFSLGIVLYELLTGRRLFKAKTRDETLARVRRAEVPSPRGYRPEISEDIEEIVLKSLAQRRDDRYPTAGAMLEDLHVLMVREQHRATNNDLAAYMKDVIENAGKGRSDVRGDRPAPPASVVVLAVEATPPPRSLASPRTALNTLTQEWSSAVGDADGDIWESEEGSLLVVWVCDGQPRQDGAPAPTLKEALERAVTVCLQLQKLATKGGYRTKVLS